MGIARIKKVQILAHQSIKEDVVEILQRLALIHIINIKELLPEKEKQEYSGVFAERHKELEKDFQEVSYALELMRFYEAKTTAKSFLKERPLVSYGSMEDTIFNFDYKELLKKVFMIDNRLKHIKSEQTRMLHEIELLSPIIKLEVPLEEIRPTHKTNIFLGSLPKEQLGVFYNELKQASSSFHMQRISENNTLAYVLILYLKAEEEKIAPVIRKNNFSLIFMPHLKGTPLGALKQFEAELEGLQEEEKALEKNILELSAERYKLMVVYDYILGLKQRQGAFENFLATEKSFLLEAWVRNKDIPKLQKELSVFNEVDIFVSDPKKGEEIPVCLDNRQSIRPFEVVTDLYGKPVYSGLDPTPFLAPFFAVFFAMCLTDAGYGITLAAICAVLLKKLKLDAAGKNFLKLLFISGIITVVAGVLTGGFFGDITSRIPALGLLEKLRVRLMILDPMQKPLVFLVFAIILGYIQILTGISIKLIKNAVSREWWQVVFNDVPVFAIQTDLLLFALTMAGVLPKTAMFPVIGGVFVLSALLIVVNQLVSYKDIAQKIFWSIFAVYGVITGNCLADILSYSRLFALGLTTSLLALAINNIVYIVAAIPYVGIVLAVLIFVGGHTFNIAINVLGGYVHTSRLQYLEFFGKFFEGGGKPFKPFRIETKYTVIVEK